MKNVIGRHHLYYTIMAPVERRSRLRQILRLHSPVRSSLLLFACCVLAVDLVGLAGASIHLWSSCCTCGCFTGCFSGRFSGCFSGCCRQMAESEMSASVHTMANGSIGGGRCAEVSRKQDPLSAGAPNWATLTLYWATTTKLARYGI